VATLRTEMLVFTYQSTCDIADSSSLQQPQISQLEIMSVKFLTLFC